MVSTSMSMLGSENSPFALVYLSYRSLYNNRSSIFLLDWNYVGEPSRVMDGLEETSIYELLYFLFNSYLQLWPEVSRGLFYWHSSLFDVEFVRDQSRV